MSYTNLTKYVIDPGALIKEAEQNALTRKTASEEPKTSKTAEKTDVKKDESLNKKATSAIDSIKALLRDEGIVIEKKAEKPKEEKSEEEKSAAAKAIDTEMKGEVIAEKIAEEGEPKKDEPVIKLSVSFSSVDPTGLNEKVASAGKYAFLGKAKKPILIGLGMAGAGGAGFLGGAAGGEKKLRNYITADKKRDQVVTNQAFRAGQVVMFAKLRRAFSSQKGAANG